MPAAQHVGGGDVIVIDDEDDFDEHAFLRDIAAANAAVGQDIQRRDTPSPVGQAGESDLSCALRESAMEIAHD